MHGNIHPDGVMRLLNRQLVIFLKRSIARASSLSQRSMAVAQSQCYDVLQSCSLYSGRCYREFRKALPTPTYYVETCQLMQKFRSARSYRGVFHSIGAVPQWRISLRLELALDQGPATLKQNQIASIGSRWSIFRRILSLSLSIYQAHQPLVRIADVPLLRLRYPMNAASERQYWRYLNPTLTWVMELKSETLRGTIEKLDRQVHGSWMK
jgi:hypothetical protein